MIDINKLTEYIQTRLQMAYNAVNEPLKENIEFKLFTDTGVLQKDIVDNQTNKLTEYINGLIVPMPSDRYFLSNGLEVASLPLRLEIIVALEDDEQNGGVYEEDIEDGTVTVTQAFIGNVKKLEIIRKVLDNAFNSQQVIDTISDGEKDFVVSIVAQISEDGNRAFAPIVGLSFTYSVSLLFSVVENGINSRQGYFTLDGHKVAFSNFTLSNIKTSENLVFSNGGGRSNSIPTASNIQFIFELVALSNDIPTKSFIQDLITNQDLSLTHFFTLEIDEIQQSFLVNISENNAMFSGVQNVGIKLCLTVAPQNYNLLSFSDNYKIYSVINTNSLYLQKGIYIIFDENGENLFKIDVSNYDFSAPYTITVQQNWKIVTTVEHTNQNLQEIQ